MPLIEALAVTCADKFAHASKTKLTVRRTFLRSTELCDWRRELIGTSFNGGTAIVAAAVGTWPQSESIQL